MQSGLAFRVGSQDLTVFTESALEQSQLEHLLRGQPGQAQRRRRCQHERPGGQHADELRARYLHP
ncbi:MAG: hypothetical protein ABIO78_04795, partial [Thermoanaerobaculia bacterium]